MEDEKAEYSEEGLAKLPKVVQEEDPEKFYWPSSPSSEFKEMETSKSGDTHFWDVWFGQKPFSYYDEKDTRFVSEFGFQSFPEMETIKTFAKLKQDY